MEKLRVYDGNEERFWLIKSGEKGKAKLRQTHKQHEGEKKMPQTMEAFFQWPTKGNIKKWKKNTSIQGQERNFFFFFDSWEKERKRGV